MPRLLFVLTCVTLQRLSLWVAPMGSRALWISVGCGQWEVPPGDQKAERARDCIIYLTGSLPVGSLRLTVTLLWRPQLLPTWSFPSQIPEPLPPQSFGCRSGYSSTILALTFCAIHPGFLQPARTFINSPFIKPLSWWGSASWSRVRTRKVDREGHCFHWHHLPGPRESCLLGVENRDWMHGLGVYLRPLGVCGQSQSLGEKGEWAMSSSWVITFGPMTLRNPRF